MAQYDFSYGFGLQTPYQPLYETTKNEIQRSIFNLQEKLRRRKQIDYELGRQIQQEYALKSAIQFQRDASNIQILQNLEHSRRALRSMSHANFYKPPEIDAKWADIDHLAMIQRLRMERDLLARDSHTQIKRQNQYQYQDNHNNIPLYDQEEQDLLKKYENGSKAKEYYRELQKKQNDQKDADKRYKIYVSAKKKQIQQKGSSKQMFFDRQKMLRNEDLENKQFYQTPYDKIKESEAKQTPQIFNQNKSDDRSLLDKNKRPQNQDFGASKINKLFEKSPNQKKQDTLDLNSTKNISSNKVNIQRKSPYAAYMKSNKYYSASKLKRSGSSLNASQKLTPKGKKKQNMKQIQLGALKKIQNRLKVSQIIFEDSQYKNIKYEINHLFNTYENEIKTRKDIKQKLNNHPIILRKHAMVVE